MKRAFSSSVFCRRSRFPVEILLIHHKKLGLWLPVGGKLEVAETPLEAASREVFEETGLIPVFPKIKYAPASTPPGFLGYAEHAAGDAGYLMNFCFLADVPRDAEPKSDGSWDHHQWINPYDAQGDKTLGAPQNVIDVLWQILVTRTE